MFKTTLATATLLAATVAQAHTIDFVGTFTPEGGGGRTGSGTLYMQYDEHGRTLLVNADWSGLSGNTTVSHIHCCFASPATSAGVALSGPGNNFAAFPAGVNAGHYFTIVDLTNTANWNTTFLANNGGSTSVAEATLIAGLMAQTGYMNIHTSTFGGGEIRAFVTVVPEPGSWALMALGLAAVGVAARRRVG